MTNIVTTQTKVSPLALPFAKALMMKVAWAYVKLPMNTV